MRLKAPHLEDDVAMGQHRALGRAGRARGVDDDRHVARLAAWRCGPPIRRGCSRACASPSARSSSSDITCGSEKVAQALHVEHDDLPQARRALAHGQDLVELLLVLHEQVLGVAVVDEILDLRRRVGRIDAGGDAGRAQHAKIAEQPLLVVVGQDGGALARLQPERDQARADGLGRLAVLRPRCRPSRCRGPSRACATLSGRVVTRCQNRPGTVVWPSIAIG